MTVEEAIKILDVNVICSPKAIQFKEAVETIKKALEKQIPKAVKEFLPFSRAKCPACNGIMGAHASRKYCYYCGQALDWSDTE